MNMVKLLTTEKIKSVLVIRSHVGLDSRECGVNRPATEKNLEVVLLKELKLTFIHCLLFFWLVV